MSAINHTTWRQTPHVLSGFLRVLKPATVFGCVVNQTSFVYPIGQITYDGGAGDYTDVVVGQTIVVKSEAGVFKGFLRVRDDPTSTVIYFGHVSQGEIFFEDNDTFTILNDFRIWTRLPLYLANGTRYKDFDIAFASQKLPPVCVAGPDRAKFVSGGVATFDFDLTDSYVTDDGASSISVYSAALPSGVSVSSGSIASGEFTLQCDPGEYYVHFTVEDDLGTTHTRHVYIYAAEETGENAPHRCVVESLSSSLDSGTEAKFGLLQDTLDETEFWDGAHVIFFVDESYGATQGSINGYPDAENVGFVGWIRNIEVGIEPELSDVVLDCAGAFGIAELYRAFPLSVQRDSTPDDWDEVDDLSVWKQAVYLLHWHSTLPNVADLEQPDWAESYDIPDRLESQYGSIIDQMQFLANAAGGRRKFTCDLQGRLYMRTFPSLMTASERSALSSFVDLEASDWTDRTEVRKKSYASASWIRGAAVLSSTSTIRAVASIAPGTSPAQGIIEEQTNNQAVTSQSELNTITGHKFAQVNRQYEEFTVHVFRAGRPIDPAWQQVVTLDLPGSSNKRGLEFTTADLFVVTELDIEFDHERGTTNEQWTLQEITSGIAGTTVPVEDDVITNPSYVPLLPWTYIDFYEPEPITELPGTSDLAFPDVPAAYAYTPSGVYRTRDTSTPTYETVFDVSSVVGAEFEVTDFKVNPWNIKEGAAVSVADFTNNYIRLYTTDNLNSPNPTWSLERELDLSDKDALYGVEITYSININGYLGVYYSHDSAVVGAFFMWDYKLTPTSSWASVEILNVPSGSEERSIGMGSHQIYPDGDIYVLAAQNNVFGFAGVYKSTNLGASWAQDEDISSYRYSGDLATHCISVPYLDNNGDEIVWFFLYNPDSADCIFRRNADGTYTGGFADIDDAATDYFTIPNTAGVHNFAKRAGEVWVGDSNEIRYVSGNQNGTGFDQLVYSEDGANSWIKKSLPAGTFWGIGSWPNDANVMFVYGNGVLYWTDDKGDTWYDLSGDLFTVADDDNILGFVPIWVP